MLRKLAAGLALALVAFAAQAAPEPKTTDWVVKDDIVFSDPEFHKREMTLIGSRNALKADFEHVAASIRDGAVPLDKLVTHRTTLAGTPRDLARWTHEKSGLIKAVIEVG